MTNDLKQNRSISENSVGTKLCYTQQDNKISLPYSRLPTRPGADESSLALYAKEPLKLTEHCGHLPTRPGADESSLALHPKEIPSQLKKKIILNSESYLNRTHTDACKTQNTQTHVNIPILVMWLCSVKLIVTASNQNFEIKKKIPGT